jgi:hypothetical protein
MGARLKSSLPASAANSNQVFLHCCLFESMLTRIKPLFYQSPSACHSVFRSNCMHTSDACSNSQIKPCQREYQHAKNDGLQHIFANQKKTVASTPAISRDYAN